MLHGLQTNAIILVIPTAVKCIGLLEIDLSDVDIAAVFPSKRIERIGSTLYLASVEIITVLDDHMGYMYFKMRCNGKQIGQVRLKFADKEDLRD
jgi:hypothetical protein